jgi:hypothetical protein
MTQRRTAHSRNRQGTRWTFYGLPGGYTTARPSWMSTEPHRPGQAIPLITFRARGLYDPESAARVAIVRDWIHRTHELAP